VLHGTAQKCAEGKPAAVIECGCALLVSEIDEPVKENLVNFRGERLLKWQPQSVGVIAGVAEGKLKRGRSVCDESCRGDSSDFESWRSITMQLASTTIGSAPARRSGDGALAYLRSPANTQAVSRFACHRISQARKRFVGSEMRP
jgi:hypothetical protein